MTVLTRGSFRPYLPRLVVEWAAEGRPPGVLELDGTFVSLDVSGFTRLSEQLQAKGRAGAEELVLLVSGVFQGLIGIAERHGGDVLKFRGDALLILFADPGHEQRACRAASEMQWLIEQTGTTMSSVGSVALRMSVGIHSGPCAFFLVEGTHRELLVAGTAATATIALESDAEAGEILVSERTAAALAPGAVGAAKGSGRLLVWGAPEEADVAAHLAQAGTDVELAAYVPQSLRAHLVLESGEAEHRQVTAAFLKFSGSDELDPSTLHARLDALAKLVGATAHELGVTWLESDIDSGGGKLYLVAGAPSSTGADEDRMLRAVHSIVAEYGELPLRAGLNRGPAFCGDIGALTRRTYAVMGDTVNLAARLVGRAERGQILATADVLDRARTRFATSAQPFLMKGKERAVTAYSVGAPTGVRDEEAAAELPFVGRELELTAFGEGVNAARIRQLRLLELVGEPGIGKSRLVEELKRLALGFTQLEGRCDPYSTSTPYHVFRALLRPLAGITPEMSPAEAGAHLAGWVQAVLPDLAPWLPLLAIPFGAEVEPTPESEELDPAFRREKLHEVVDQFLLRVLVMPTLIVVEDVHWIDDASQFLLRYVTSSAVPRPWLVCVTRRPQGAPITADKPGHVQLEIEPLGAAATAHLALTALGDAAVAETTLDVLTSRSGGNPLFVRELVSAARAGATALELPETVETLIVSRIDTLEPEDRFLLRNAAVLGARFELDLLAEVVADELEDVTELERWERLHEFVAFVEPNVLGFLHDLFRLAAYEGLSFRRRRELHARVGAALERRGAEPSLLSLHFLHAEEYETAWSYAVEAGDAARAGYANVVASELYARALQCADHIDLPADDVSRVAEALGDVAELAAQYDTAAAAYARAERLAAFDVIAATRLLWKQGVLHERRAHYADALACYTQALEALALEDDAAATENRVELELATAGVMQRQGKFADTLEWASRAAEHAEAAGLLSQLAHAYQLLDIAHTRLADGDRGFRGRALPIYEQTGDLIGQARVLQVLGIDAYYEGRWDESLDAYRRSRELLRRAGDVVLAATATNNEAEILSDRGRLDDAEELFEDALRVWRAAGYRIGIALATSNLARTASRGGRFDLAGVLFDEALPLFEEIGAELFVLETRGRQAEWHVFQGNHREARELLDPLLENGATTQTAMLERLVGYAIVQSRAPFAEAAPHFARSVEIARERRALYELALTLRALADTSGADHAEADELFERLGVVTTPAVPLP